ncbi:unnamed protein product [Paramecium sonneborni]|uniref:VWFA domain-containing protein n=1 Tax=Paramecium sonneborni TaxID=65129 RepID=A0A8S1KL71_9CILI|nr:unnamed protein product [Paramecium sonneborni]
MIQQNKNYLKLTSLNNDIQQQNLQRIHDDEIPEKYRSTYKFNDFIDINYGYQDNNQLLFEIKKNFPKQSDFQIGVDLIYLIDISQSLNDETLEKIKSALKCLVNSLSDRDRLSIILYNNKVDKLFPLIPLNQKNKQIIFEKIEQIINKKGNSNILNAAQVANQCLKLRQFKNEVTSINIISQDQSLGKYCYELEQLFQKEKQFKLKAYLLLQQNKFQSCQIKKRGNEKLGKIQIVKNVDYLSSYLCFEVTKLQQTVIRDLLITIKTNKNNPIKISECEGVQFLYVNPYEIQISKKLVSIGYNKTHLICVGNIPKNETGQLCDVEVSYKYINSNQKKIYTIPIYAQPQKNGIIDEKVIVQKYKLKSRSQMNEAILYYDPYRIQDCTEILKIFQSEVESLPDCIKQQLNGETQQFEIALQKYLQDPSQQIENPFNKIDDLQKSRKYKIYENL